VATQNLRLVLRCKRCQWNLTAPQSICKKCGISPAYIIKREIDSDILSLCKTCNNSIIHAAIPHHCIYCGSLAYDWWDYQERNWLAPNLTLKRNIKGIWLIGEFEGDFVGTLASTGIPNDLSVKQNYHRDYDIKISHGHLINYRFTDRRPNLPIKPDPKPIRQDFCNSILVKDLNSDQYFPANLADLVIFDWHRISEKEFLDQNKIAGHLKGTLCACLIKEEEFEKVATPPPDIQPDSFTSDIPLGQHIENSATGPAQQLTSSPTETAVNAPSAQNGDTRLPPVPPQSHEDNTEDEIPKTEVPGVRELLKSGNLEDCLLCNNFVLVVLSILLFFYFRSDEKWSDYFWCHLVQALFFIFVTKAVCIFGDEIQERRWAIEGFTQRKKFRNFLIGVSLFSLLVVFSNFNQSHCFQLSSFGIWELISLVCFILSAFIKDCFSKTCLAILFAFVVMLTMNCSKLNCNASSVENHAKKQSVTSQVMNAKKKVENTYVEQTANWKEGKVKALTGSSNENKKVTTNDLVENPNLLNDCSTSIYLGELGLFERNSFNIKETAVAKLEQLSSWMAEQDRTKKFIITGHADQTGEKFENGVPNPVGYARNMRLSKQRAAAVAQWILEHESIDSAQLIVRGVGSSEPLTTDEDPEVQKMNIRVELKANCETDNKGVQ
jgi:outer membrane protein OmpA-like peptidoglycan-associated protein